MISADPLLPAWLIAVLAALLAGAALLAYRRAAGMLALRLAAVAILSAMLANPVRIPPAVASEQARLVLVADASASMALADADGGTRLAAALAALERAAAAAPGRFAVEWWTLDEGLRPGRPAAAAGGTAFDGLAALAAAPPAAVILASDGAERGVAEPDAALAAAGVPVSCLAVGAAADAGNVAIRLDAPSPTAFPGQELALTAVVACTADYAGRQAELALVDDAGARSVRTVILADGLRVPLAAPAGDRAGSRVWTASLPVLDGEAAAADNASAAAVRVVDRRLAVVVAEGRPWWDSAAAVRSWRRDRQFATAAFWRAGARTLATGDGGAAPDAAVLAAADLIVLGVEPERVLDEAGLAAVSGAVAGGAGVILLAPGPRPGALAALDPVLWSAEPPRQTPATLPPGAPPLLPAELLPQLPPVLARGADGLRPGAAVLLGSADRPLATLRRHGAGRVLSVNAEGLWRWSLGREDDAAGGLWRQLARLVVRDPGGLSADRPRYRVGQEARLALGDGQASVTDPAGTTRPLAAADGAAALRPDAPGLWRVAAAGQELILPVEADLREVTATARRDRRLERLAAATGGIALPAGQAAELGARLARRAELAADAPRPVPLAAEWWWWTLAVAALAAAEWWLRRSRHGTV